MENKPIEVVPGKLSLPGKAGIAYGGGARGTEPAGKGRKPKPMEAEPEKLSSPGKAGSQAYEGGAREAQPTGKGWSRVYFLLHFDLTATSFPNLKTRIKLIK
jgi:hypothetical protein